MVWCVHGGRSTFGNSVPHYALDGVCQTIVSPTRSDAHDSKPYRAMERDQTRKQSLGLRAFVGVARIAAISTGQFGTGAILIRASNRKGEKSLGRRGLAFARVPGLGWHLTPHCA